MAEYGDKGWAILPGKYETVKRVRREEDISRFSFDFDALERCCTQTKGKRLNTANPTEDTGNYSLVHWNCEHWVNAVWRKIVEFINKNR